MSTVIDQPDVDIDTDIDAAFSSIIENEEVVEDDDSGDHDRFAHYVEKEKIVESSMTGKPVPALCGKLWTPSRSPQNLPVCPPCKEVFDGLLYD